MRKKTKKEIKCKFCKEKYDKNDFKFCPHCMYDTRQRIYIPSKFEKQEMTRQSKIVSREN